MEIVANWDLRFQQSPNPHVAPTKVSGGMYHASSLHPYRGQILINPLYGQQWSGAALEHNVQVRKDALPPALSPKKGKPKPWRDGPCKICYPSPSNMPLECGSQQCLF
mmetsp:Transcript_18252/g.38334  ORF Transcript_18252/g.38334 Transcript_18252/m.38334 type:complete len:108 (+) Transcript_18252:303-626(+)